MQGQSTQRATLAKSLIIRSILGLFAEFDWWLAGATVFLAYIGLFALSHQGSTFFSKQVDFLIAGTIAAIVFWRIPYFIWTQRWILPVLYIMNLLLLVAVMLKGHSAMGAQRWLALGPLTVQPSEIAKIVTVFTLAGWLSKRPIKGFGDCFKALALILAPAVLVFKQPDLGTSLTFGAIYLGMVYWAGASFADMVVLVSPAISIILNAVGLNIWQFYLSILGLWLIVFWRPRTRNIRVRLILALVVLLVNFASGEARPFMWSMLKEYQQKRLTSFLNPYEDPRGSGYHILQSLIAIGSGGLKGAGLGHGNQSQGAFIPERHTDFIFAVIGEELGFCIAAPVILAYALICIRAALIAWQSRGEPVGSLMAIGFMFMFLFHVFLNIGMTMGIMPVAGVPLPFLSYGGTALIIDLIAIGILMSIRSLHPPARRDIWT